MAASLISATKQGVVLAHFIGGYWLPRDVTVHVLCILEIGITMYMNSVVFIEGGALRGSGAKREIVISL